MSTAAITDKHSKNIPKLFYWIVGLAKNGMIIIPFMLVYITVEGEYQRVGKSFMSAFRILYHKMLLN